MKPCLSRIGLQAILFFSLQLSAQVPQLINYQARLTDHVTGLPVADATGIYSTSMGYYTTAGSFSTAMGSNTTASGTSAFTAGSNTIASGSHAAAMGSSTTASGIGSTALGNMTTASGFNSTAMGYYANATGTMSFAIHLNGSAAGPNVGDNIFRISGASAIGGNLAWTNYSDQRLKKDIQALSTENNLAKIKQLNGVRFRWKDNETMLNLGFIGQEFKDIIPESVRYDELNDIYSMEYTAIIPVLVEGIKEQQEVIEALKSEIEELREILKNK